MADWKRMPHVTMTDGLTPEDVALSQALLITRVLVSSHVLDDGATVEVIKTTGPWPGLEGTAGGPCWLVSWCGRAHIPWPSDAHPNVLATLEVDSCRIQTWFFLGDPRGCEGLLKSLWGFTLDLGDPSN
jgi:hypothetical protein